MRFFLGFLPFARPRGNVVLLANGALVGAATFTRASAAEYWSN